MITQYESKYHFISGDESIDSSIEKTIEVIGKIRELGDIKYSPFSWENSPETSDATIINNLNAFMRHFTCMQVVSEIDESGFRHIEHLLIRSMFLLTITYRRLLGKFKTTRYSTKDIDDRVSVRRNISPELLVSFIKYNSIDNSRYYHKKIKVTDGGILLDGINLYGIEQLSILKQYYIDSLTALFTDVKLTNPLVKLSSGDSIKDIENVDVLNTVLVVDQIFYLVHELYIVDNFIRSLRSSKKKDIVNKTVICIKDLVTNDFMRSPHREYDNRYVTSIFDSTSGRCICEVYCTDESLVTGSKIPNFIMDLITEDAIYLTGEGFPDDWVFYTPDDLTCYEFKR